VSYGFVANFIHFPAVQIFENRLRFDKLRESVKVGTVFRHTVVLEVQRQFTPRFFRHLYSWKTANLVLSI